MKASSLLFMVFLHMSVVLRNQIFPIEIYFRYQPSIPSLSIERLTQGFLFALLNIWNSILKFVGYLLMKSAFNSIP